MCFKVVKLYARSVNDGPKPILLYYKRYFQDQTNCTIEAEAKNNTDRSLLYAHRKVQTADFFCTIRAIGQKGNENTMAETIKEEMTNYWSRRVEKFSDLRCREYASEKHEQWLAELNRHLTQKRPLNILDIGTGTGFFALLLAEQGHHVTGIDLTPDMIRKAKQIAEKLNLSVEFSVMDGEKPDFPAHSFDVIVTRKLTWALPNLSQTYKNWHDLLKPEGILINFDADYCREKEAAALPAHHAHQDVSADLMQEYEHMKGILRPMQQPRPDWDVQLLSQAGFHGITVDTGVWQRVYKEMDEFYDPTSGFAITATA